MAETILILDASVLINFLKVNRVDLLSRLDTDLVITEHVRNEVTEHYSEQVVILEQAVADGVITELRIDDLEEIEAVNNFRNQPHSKRLGWGECSAIIAASRRGYRLGIDDRRAIEAAKLAFPTIQILRTEDLVVEMIHGKLLTVGEADGIKTEWETLHKFRRPFGSFAELVTRR